MSDIYTKEGQRATATVKLCLTVEDLLAIHDRAMGLALLAEENTDYRIAYRARMYQTAVTLELASRLRTINYALSNMPRMIITWPTGEGDSTKAVG